MNEARIYIENYRFFLLIYKIFHFTKSSVLTDSVDEEKKKHTHVDYFRGTRMLLYGEYMFDLLLIAQKASIL